MNDDKHSMVTPPYPQMPSQWERPEEEISLIDLLHVLAKRKRLILSTMLVFAVLAIGIALTQESEYTSSATVVREQPLDGAAGMGALSALRGFGISLGGASMGLSPEAYPDILQSSAVRMAVAQSQFYFSDLDTMMTFVEYANRPSGMVGQVADAVLSLPGKLRRWMSGSTKTGVNITEGDGGYVYITEEEDNAIKQIGKLVSTSSDLETGLMRISVETTTPVLSAELTQRFVEELRTRVRAVRTQKSREDLAFIEAQFAEAERKLRTVEEALATFLDRNTGVTAARVRTEQDRLQRQVRFATELYTELQSQLTQARLEAQRSEPIVTLIEEPVVPVEPSGPNRKLTVILGLILGGVVGVALALGGAALQKQEENEEERKKLDEIKAAFLPKRWRNGHAKATPEASV